MSHLYTSYETSLRLKQAGAPQAGVEYQRACPDCGSVRSIDEDGCCATCGRDTTEVDVRFFRADEIIEARLMALDLRIAQEDNLDWTVALEVPRKGWQTFSGFPLVEPIAAAWIAVLEAK